MDADASVNSIFKHPLVNVLAVSCVPPIEKKAKVIPITATKHNTNPPIIHIFLLYRSI